MSTSKPESEAEDWSAEIAELRARQAAAREMGGADKVQVQQVVLNLVRNAIEAMLDSPRRLLSVALVRFQAERTVLGHRRQLPIFGPTAVAGQAFSHDKK